MRLPSRRRKRAGSALLLVLALLFVITTIILVVFNTQNATREALLREYDSLLLRQRFEFELADIALDKEAPPAPTWLRRQADKDFDDTRIYTADVAADPFSGIPEVSRSKTAPKTRDLAEYPGYRYIGLSSVGTQHSLAVLSQYSRYAVVSLASGSGGKSIDFDAVKAWRNPEWGQSAEPQTAYSATAPYLLANGPVRVGDFPYGYLYQAAQGGNDSVSLGSRGQSSAVAFLTEENFAGVDELDPVTLRQNLESQLAGAMEGLRRNALQADRTDILSGAISEGDSLGMFFSQMAAPSTLRNRLSLKESQGYWLPTVPTIKKQFIILWHVIFHVPASPDGGLGKVSRDARAVLTKLIDAVQALNKAIDALKDAEDALDKAQREVEHFCKCDKWPWHWPCCAAKETAKVALEAAKLALKAAEAALTIAENAVMVIISPITDGLDAALAASGQVPPPRTRNKEKTFQQDTGVEFSEKGMEAWAYRQIFDDIGNIVSDLFSGRFSKVGSDLGKQVTVVFFGQGDKVQDFHYPDGGFSSHATWNVPAGKTFYYDGDMTIYGDLWLARGSSFVVDGGLTLYAGDQPSGEGGSAPQGTLHLEEGATLVVSGAFTAQGEPGRGSVLVCGPMGGVSAITSAVLAGGDVNLPNGVAPGVSLDSIKTVGDNAVGDDLSALSSQFFQPFLSEIAPNLAKVDGPFHSRWPYIAMYATTFEWILEIDAPFVVPMDFPNFHVMVFNGLTYLYAPTLNFEIGENLLTHCDWWGQPGEGRPPILTKPEAVALAGNSPEPPSLAVTLSDAQSAVDSRSSRIGAGEVDRFANDLILQLTAQWSQAISSKTGIPLVSWGTVASKILQSVADDYYNLSQRKSDLASDVPAGSSGLTSGLSTVWQSIDDVRASTANDLPSLAQECSGALIYSGGNLSVGGEDTPLSAGYFVARRAITLNSQVTVGSAVSLEYGVEGKTLLFYPPFTQASLYLPAPEAASWMDRGKSTRYGPNGRDGRSRSEKYSSVGDFTPRLLGEVRGR